MDDEESSESSEMHWQVINTKRKKSTMLGDGNKKQKQNDATCASTNKYALLDIADDGIDNVGDDGERIPKPPPIFIPGITNITKMINNLSSVISNNDFNYKSIHGGQIKLNVKSVDSFRKTVKYFETNNISFHTYQLKTERAFRVVIKGLHHTTPVENIKAELILQGHQVRYIVNVKSKISKEPLPMFYVDLDPDPDNKNIFNIRYIDNAVVTIEPQRKISDIVQCHRCQEYGHTKTYCKKPYVCVKCGLNHPSINCPKERDSPARCIHCLKSHTANYKGCQVYQNLVRKRTPENNIRYRNFSLNQNDFPPVNPNVNKLENEHFNQGVSYASVLNHDRNINNNFMKNIETLLNKQIELTTTLMNMMSLLINKLCK